MSIKDRLTKKTEGLLVPTRTEASSIPANSPLRTGPGQMLMVNSLMKESNDKIQSLENRLLQFDGASVVRKLDAAKIRPSAWANRVEESFGSADFLRLKNEINEAGGNVQPIKVRPTSGAGESYEIVFGHRRHRACMELGLPVLAQVEAVDDQALFKEMERENRVRADLSAWEQGTMYRRALDAGLFSSLGDLAKEIGVDKGNVSKALRLADLPREIVQAFASPIDLQFRFSKPLADALAQDAEEVIRRAKRLAGLPVADRTAKMVLDTLLGNAAPMKTEYDIVVGKKRAQMVFKDGKVVVQFAQDAVPPSKALELKKLIEDFLKK